MDLNRLNAIFVAAEKVLCNNIRVSGDETYIVPNWMLYPAAWGWDTPMNAMGLYLYKPQVAIDVLKTFLAYQWPNGMLPQIVFPEHAENEKLEPTVYFPPPHVWYYKGDEIIDYDAMDIAEVTDHPGFQLSKGKTTGIEQYPIWAICLEKMQQVRPLPEQDLKEILYRIDAFHEFFVTERDPAGLGIAAEFHPWMGCDNAPCYDIPMRRVYQRTSEEDLKKINRQRMDTKKTVAEGGDISVRPTDHDYACFLYLAQKLAVYTEKRLRGDATGLEDLDFVIYSPFLNAMLVRADMALAQLAKEAKNPSLEEKAYERAQRRHDGIMKHLWRQEPGAFVYFDAVSGEGYQTEFFGAYGPLMEELLPDSVRENLLMRFKDTFLRGYKHALPSTAKTNPQQVKEKSGYAPYCYWRGPKWLVLDGLFADCLPPKESQDLKQNTLNLIEKEGFREYYNPETGEGYGAISFGWSAAFAAYWAYEMMNQKKQC